VIVHTGLLFLIAVWVVFDVSYWGAADQSADLLRFDPVFNGNILFIYKMYSKPALYI